MQVGLRGSGEREQPKPVLLSAESRWPATAFRELCGWTSPFCAPPAPASLGAHPPSQPIWTGASGQGTGVAPPGAASVAGSRSWGDNLERQRGDPHAHPGAPPRKSGQNEVEVITAGKDLGRHQLQRWKRGVPLPVSSNPLAVAVQGAALERTLRSLLNSAGRACD